MYANYNHANRQILLFIFIFFILAESFAGKGPVIKGMRRHARMRMGEVMYRHCHYFVRLEEGTPPDEYYYSWPKTGPALLAQWLDEVRDRRIRGSL